MAVLSGNHPSLHFWALKGQDLEYQNLLQVPIMLVHSIDLIPEISLCTDIFTWSYTAKTMQHFMSHA